MDPYVYVFKCFGGKWKALILRAIYVERSVRFSKIQKKHLICEKVLSRALKDLQEEGLVKKNIYPEVPPRVEYELTSDGESLIALMDEIYRWSRRHMLDRDIPIDEEAEKWHGYSV